MNTQTLITHCVNVEFSQIFLGDLLLQLYVNIYFALPVLQNI